MADRTINFGVDSTEATYQIQDDDPTGGGDFLINDTAVATPLLQYIQSTGRWSLGSLDSTELATTSLTATDGTFDTLNGANIATAPEGRSIVTDGAGNLMFGDAVPNLGHDLHVSEDNVLSVARRTPV